jgi:hypothetical protein
MGTAIFSCVRNEAAKIRLLASSVCPVCRTLQHENRCIYLREIWYKESFIKLPLHGLTITVTIHEDLQFHARN